MSASIAYYATFWLHVKGFEELMKLGRADSSYLAADKIFSLDQSPAQPYRNGFE
jgi:hypothetical protein